MNIDGKKVNRKIMRVLTSDIYNHFLPMHEHLGFDKSITKEHLIKYIASRLSDMKIITKEDKQGYHFRDDIKKIVDYILYHHLLNPYSKTLYLRGLVTEPIKNGISHIYYISTEEESKRVQTIKTNRIKSQQKMLALNVKFIEQHLKELLPEYKKSKRYLLKGKKEISEKEDNDKGDEKK